MYTANFKFKNGQKVEDLVSGVVGIINCSSFWLNGCVRYSIQPKAKEGDNVMPEPWWVDEEQIKLIDEGVSINATRTGGPSSRSPRF